MFENYEANGANPNHKLQLFHYLKAKDMKEGHIIYISRDDLRMVEMGVFNTPENEKPYKEDIEKMSKFIKSKTKPHKKKYQIKKNQ